MYNRSPSTNSGLPFITGQAGPELDENYLERNLIFKTQQEIKSIRHTESSEEPDKISSIKSNEKPKLKFKKT